MLTMRMIPMLLILGTAAPAMALVVTPAQPVFHTGDMIEFSALNNSFATIHFPNSAPFVLHNIDTGEEFRFTALTMIISLEPGNSELFRVSSDALTPGTYEIVLSYYDDSWEMFSAFATFVFEVAVDSRPGSTGLLKLRFRAQESSRGNAPPGR